jgi:hypothetical protein
LRDVDEEYAHATAGLRGKEVSVDVVGGHDERTEADETKEETTRIELREEDKFCLDDIKVGKGDSHVAVARGRGEVRDIIQYRHGYCHCCSFCLLPCLMFLSFLVLPIVFRHHRDTVGFFGGVVSRRCSHRYSCLPFAVSPLSLVSFSVIIAL